MPDRHLQFAREALLDITGEATIGDYVGSVDEGEGVVTVRFESTLPGYPGWRWTVSLAVVDGGEPTVLETELMPADGALLAPDWVPWSDRLADYKAAQEAADAAAAESEPDGDDAADDDDLDDDSDDDDDLLGSDVLHGGDLDGVDIDDPDDDDDDDDDAEDALDDRDQIDDDDFVDLDIDDGR